MPLVLLMLHTFFYKTSYLNEEFNHTKPSPSACVPWLGIVSFLAYVLNLVGCICDGSVERDSFYESQCLKQQLIKTNITFLSPKQNFAHEKIIFFLEFIFRTQNYIFVKLRRLLQSFSTWVHPGNPY
jgi:hypothetical protein